ncbi:MAG: superoxide dismutase [Candidatus Marinimicrobia bacterium]|nr:superoxide dismutase [Candidatus Neomarinimicrobiota bacterium]|tara:strand:+ start:23385 stop:23966 length:582 start_codon:yes stop_codon:yes gene_type:complete
MEHRLPDLPYEKDSLEPHISSETLEYHHGKHHNTYVQNLNKLIQGTEFEDQDLDEIVANATGGLFNNAAQHWNHSFYWDCMSPNGGGEPSGTLAQAINGAFGSFDEFKDLFSNTAITTFGSGWAWLVSNDGGNLQIVSAKNAENPISSGQTPLLTCDVWEHAYYIDYRNARPKYVEAFWNVINWDFVIEKLES